MAIKSPNQRKFVFSVLDDKKKGITPQKPIAPTASNGMNMSETVAPKPSIVKPVTMKSVVPKSTIPALPTLAKFAKVKKFFK